MLVRSESLDVFPAADRLLEAAAGRPASDVEMGDAEWSNELALHVVEFKTAGPAPALAPLPGLFQEQVRHANALLAPLGGRLMPTGMHPWMDPLRETRLWPDACGPIYSAFDRLFGCSGHGWSNVQSMHINLPFHDDREFGRLHAAIRLLLPLLPALAASSPLVEGHGTGSLDSRLTFYGGNCARVPSITGRVVPEGVWTRRDYEEGLLGGIYRDLAPLDPEGVLRHEWVNARGAIARFDRGAIEIRVLDVQECPLADLAVAHLIVEVLRALVEERWLDLEAQRAWEVDPLARIYRTVVRDAERARVEDPRYLEAMGLEGARPVSAGEVWASLAERTAPAGRAADPAMGRALRRILERGCLSRRILEALGPSSPPERQREVYEDLCDCLAVGRLFEAP
ncbi:MAG: glutamate--cysteine ligase [Planctomycetes bacterium]|nr:glutamate--cysteine ligase [Planctomycetota bacterium]